MRTRLRNAAVVTMNCQSDILEDCDLLLNDDRIEKILPKGTVDRIQADKELSCKGKIIIPGLISAHSHLTGIFQRGLWDETSFAQWLSKSTATEELVNLSAEEICFLHCGSCIEFIRNGVTTALNMFTVRPPLDPAKLDAACRAFVDTGMRGILAVLLKDRSPDGEPFAVNEDESWIDRLKQAAKRVSQFGSTVTFMLAPSAPQLCSDRLLINCRNIAEELNLGIHTHLAETKQHAEIGRRLYGESIVQHLENLGFLSARLSVAHTNWLDETDMDVLRKYEVKVVHNPSANTKLGSGFAKVKKMLRKNLTLALGADSVNAGTIYSIFEQMKLSVLVPRVLWESDNWLLPEDAFAMGTTGGAKALLLDQVTGSIEEGKKADLVILNPATSLMPLNNIINQLVLGESDKSVETVFVDGKLIVLEGNIQTVDEKNILGRISALAPRIQAARAQVLATRAH